MPIPDGMTKVELTTQTGGYVVHVGVPGFVPMPEVVVWGERTFKTNGKNAKGEHVYAEALVYVVQPDHEEF